MDTLNPMFKEFNLPVRRMLYYSRLVYLQLANISICI